MVADNPIIQSAIEKVRSKGVKYSMVSVVNVFVGQGLLIMLHAIWGLNATLSNVISVCLSAIPAFYLSRAWVWQKRGRIGKTELRNEVLPFWAFVIVGLVFSTIVVSLATKVSKNALVPNIASMAAFGMLWVIRFFLMDLLFRHRPHLVITEAASGRVGPDDGNGL